MKLVLPADIIQRIRREVRRYRREIGGILVGEHVEDQTFRIVDFSVQTSGGTAVHFVRDPEHAQQFLGQFFGRTGNDFQKYNYIGEWHSHPGFMPLPSGEDQTSMFNIVNNPDVGVNFAVLMIARARLWNRLELSATAFRKSADAPDAVTVEVEPSHEQPSAISCFFSWIRR